MSSGPFDQTFCGMARIPNGFIPLKCFSQFIEEFIENGISKSFMLSLKCDHPFFYENSPSYF